MSKHAPEFASFSAELASNEEAYGAPALPLLCRVTECKALSVRARPHPLQLLLLLLATPRARSCTAGEVWHAPACVI
jgi:hypothetical protein